MPDIDKVIKGLETCKSTDKTCSDCPYNGEVCTTSLCDDVLSLLKEQEEQSHELQQIINDGFEAMKVATKRIKELEALLKEQPDVVRCKDCKHWDEKKNECHNVHSYMQFRPCFGNWFCADGERKEGR